MQARRFGCCGGGTELIDFCGERFRGNDRCDYRLHLGQQREPHDQHDEERGIGRSVGAVHKVW